MWKYGEELKHYGVLGMKWGVRKDRGVKGTRRKKKTIIKRRRQSRKPSNDHVRSRVLRKKKISQLSNTELQEYNHRKNLEKNYKSLNPGIIATGVAAAGTAAAALGTYNALRKNIPDLTNKGKTILDSLNNVKRSSINEIKYRTFIRK